MSYPTQPTGGHLLPPSSLVGRLGSMGRMEGCPPGLAVYPSVLPQDQRTPLGGTHLHGSVSGIWWATWVIDTPGQG